MWPRRLYLHNMREHYAAYSEGAFWACLVGCALLAVALIVLGEPR